LLICGVVLGACCLEFLGDFGSFERVVVDRSRRPVVDLLRRARPSVEVRRT
jgi:hypothetical protein